MARSKFKLGYLFSSGEKWNRLGIMTGDEVVIDTELWLLHRGTIESRLERAVEEEDYETACLYRDELIRRDD